MKNLVKYKQITKKIVEGLKKWLQQSLCWRALQYAPNLLCLNNLMLLVEMLILMIPKLYKFQQ